MDRVRVWLQQIGNQGVARFVNGRQALFLVADDMAAPFRAEAYLFAGFFQFGHVDDFFIGTSRQQRRFVQQVAQIGAGKARRLLGDNIQIDVLAERLAFCVHFQDSPAAPQVRTVDGNLPVKTAGAQQRRVEDVGTVRRGDRNDAFVGAEAVHFYKQLVQRLFAFIVTAAETCAALAAYGVDFVDEDDARRVFLSLGEKIAHAGRADADEHFYEVRAADAEKGNARFAGNGPGQQGFPRARRPEEQHALGNLGSDVVVLAGIAEKFDDFRQFFLRFVFAGNVFKGYLDFSFAVHLRMALAEVHHPAAAALGLLHDEKPHADENQNRQDRAQQAHPPRRLFRRLGDDVDLRVAQGRHHSRVRRGVRCKRRAVLQLTDDGVVVRNLDCVYLFLLNLIHEIRIGNFRFISFICRKRIDDRNGNDDNQ